MTAKALTSAREQAVALARWICSGERLTLLDDHSLVTGPHKLTVHYARRLHAILTRHGFRVELVETPPVTNSDAFTAGLFISLDRKVSE